MAQPGRILPLSVRQTIKALRANGVTVREVAKTLNVNRNTASKYGRTTVGQNSGTRSRESVNLKPSGSKVCPNNSIQHSRNLLAARPVSSDGSTSLSAGRAVFYARFNSQNRWPAGNSQEPTSEDKR